MGKPETLKPKEVVSMLIDDDQIQAKLLQRKEEKKQLEKEKRKPGRKRKLDEEIHKTNPEIKQRRHSKTDFENTEGQSKLQSSSPLQKKSRLKNGALAKAAASVAAVAAGNVAGYAAYGYSFQPIATRILPKNPSPVDHSDE